MASAETLTRFLVTSTKAGTVVTWSLFRFLAPGKNLTGNTAAMCLVTPQGLGGASQYELVGRDSQGREQVLSSYDLSTHDASITIQLLMGLLGSFKSSSTFDASKITDLLFRFSCTADLPEANFELTFQWYGCGLLERAIGSQLDPLAGFFFNPYWVFGGYIASIAVKDEQAVDDSCEVTLTCRDYRLLTDAKVISHDYRATTAPLDGDVLDAVCSATGLSSLFQISNQKFRQVQVNFDFRTVSEAYDMVSAATGCDWTVQPIAGNLGTLVPYARQLIYHTTDQQTGVLAPFELSETPNPAGSPPSYGYRLQSYARDLYTPANRIFVLGGEDKTGAPVNVTYQDQASHDQYGLWLEAVLRDATIADPSFASQVGQNQVNARKSPLTRLTVRTFADGLHVGMLLPVTHSLWGRAVFVVQRVAWEQLGDPAAQIAYTVDLGDYAPNLVQFFQLQYEAALAANYSGSNLAKTRRLRVVNE